MKRKMQDADISVNNFLRIKDIRGDLLYTTDNLIQTFIQV